MTGGSQRAQDSGLQLEPGTVLADRYRLEAVLGAGAFGVVWRARHVHLDTECAVKLFAPPASADLQDTGARFLQEARVMARLKCPHVAQVFDYGVHERMPFLVLELLQGSSLAAHLTAQREQGRALAPKETARILRHVAEALQVAHAARVVHRDLKPDNIFLVREGETHIAKVLDFGIAKWNLDGAPGMTSTRTVMGTAHYMSPEQFESSRQVDQRADLWSVGVIAFECLTGQLPFPGETFIEVAFRVCKQGPLVASQIADVPAGFDAWFARSTALGREHRFASALEQAEALERVCAAAVAYAIPSAHATHHATNPPLQPGSTARSVAGPALRRTHPWRQQALRLSAAAALGAVVTWRVLFFGNSAEPEGAPLRQTTASALASHALGDEPPEPSPPAERRAADGARAGSPAVSVIQTASGGAGGGAAVAQPAARHAPSTPAFVAPTEAAIAATPPVSPGAQSPRTKPSLLEAIRLSQASNTTPERPATPAEPPAPRPPTEVYEVNAWPWTDTPKHTFDDAAARLTLDTAGRRVRACPASGGEGGTVTLSYEPSGAVASVSVTSIGSREATIACVRAEFERARVPPFTGAREIVVRKSFYIPVKQDGVSPPDSPRAARPNPTTSKDCDPPWYIDTKGVRWLKAACR